MWYDVAILTTLPKCSRCGSPLIYIDQVTEQLDGARFPQTTTQYRCSDQSCQDEKDKEAEKRIKLQEKRVTADKRNVEIKSQEKRILDSINSEEATK